MQHSSTIKRRFESRLTDRKTAECVYVAPEAGILVFADISDDATPEPVYWLIYYNGYSFIWQAILKLTTTCSA